MTVKTTNGKYPLTRIELSDDFIVEHLNTFFLPEETEEVIEEENIDELLDNNGDTASGAVVAIISGEVSYDDAVEILEMLIYSNDDYEIPIANYNVLDDPLTVGMAIDVIRLIPWIGFVMDEFGGEPSGWTDVFGEWFGYIADLLGDIADILVAGFAYVVDFLSNLGAVIVEWGLAVWGAIVNVFSDVRAAVSEVVELMRALWSWITTRISKMVDQCVELVMSGLQEVIDGIQEYLLGKIESLSDISKEDVIEMMHLPYSKLERLFYPFLTVGRDIERLLLQYAYIPRIEGFMRTKIGDALIDIVGHITDIPQELESMIRDAMDGYIDPAVKEQLEGLEIDLSTRDGILNSGITLYEEFIGWSEETDSTILSTDDGTYDKYGLIITGPGHGVRDEIALKKGSNHFKDLLNEREYDIYGDSIHYDYTVGEAVETIRGFGEMLSNDPTPENNKVIILFSGHGYIGGGIGLKDGNGLWSDLAFHLDETAMTNSGEPLYDQLTIVVSTCYSERAIDFFKVNDPSRIVITAASEDEEAAVHGWSLDPIFLTHFTNFLKGDWGNAFRFTFIQAGMGLAFLSVFTVYAKIVALATLGIILAKIAVIWLSFTATWAILSSAETAVHGGEEATLYSSFQYAYKFTRWGYIGYWGGSNPVLYNSDLAKQTKL